MIRRYVTSPSILSFFNVVLTLFSFLSIGRVHFRLKGCWMVFPILFKTCNRTFCKQTVDTLIRRHVLWRLIRCALFAYAPQKGRLMNAKISENEYHKARELLCIK